MLFLTKFLLAYDIDQMLDLYRINNDLSEKTKNESLGLLTVYTHDDLDRMQAHTLSELLNSIRSFRYDENMFGMPDPLHVDPLLYASEAVKIFINNHEIDSSYTGSGLYIYGNIDLGFVDHVEIYEGSTSSYVNSEPSMITIKLYSKDPSREFGGSIAAYGGSRGTNHENISYADVNNKFQYYAYASHTGGFRQKYEHENHAITRDYQNKHAFMNLKYMKVNVDAEIIQHTMDSFLSMSMFALPKSGDTSYTLARVGVTMNFLDDDSLEVSLSLMRIDGNMNLSMDKTRWTTNLSKLLLPSDSFKLSSRDDIIQTKIQKEFLYNKQHLIIGTQYIGKKLSHVESYNRGVKDLSPDFVNNKIISVYMQNDYALQENQILTASYKVNQYNDKSNHDRKIFTTQQLRAGYIYTSKDTVAKFFISQMEFPTEQVVLTSTPQDKIELITIRDFSAQYTKSINAHTLGTCVEIIQNENLQSVRTTYGVNKYYNNYSASIQYDFKFDPFNSFKSMAYINKLHNQVTREIDTINGGFIRFLGTWKKFDTYAEADYYRILHSGISGVNYSASLRYRTTQSLSFTIKGINIFNSAAKSRYSYVTMEDSTLVVDSLYYSPIDQLFTVGMEYKF